MVYRPAAPLVLPGAYGLHGAEGRRLVEKYRERYEVFGVHENTMYPGVPELLAALKDNGRILAVASSKPAVFVRQILDEYRLTEYFTVIEGSDLEGKHVEKEDVLRTALLRLGDHRSAVMVGDRKFDILAARRFGLKTVGAAYGYAQGRELEEAGADQIASSPAEIRKIILDTDG